MRHGVESSSCGILSGRSRWAAALLLSACGPEKAPEDTDQPSDTTDAGDWRGVIGLASRPANAACLAPSAPPQVGTLALEPVFTEINFELPLAMVQEPSGSLLIAEQGGRIWRVSDFDASERALVLDLSGVVEQPFGEMGLLGLALDPNYAQNGRIYTSYNPRRQSRSVVSRWTDTGDGFRDEVSVFEVEQPFSNHNGGHIAFGPDGYLYFGLGDGGSAGDPGNRAQDLQEYMGKFLRFDVSSLPYRVPADNPWADGVGARPEIWAYGFRNPWRWSFDRLTGDLWAGDVGQDAQEEVTRVIRAGNHGWKVWEGTSCFTTERRCNEPGFVEPVVTYAHTRGGSFSVVGGYVYRGAAMPEFYGSYFFADVYTGKVFTVARDADGAARPEEVAAKVGGVFYSFAEDDAGELYVLEATGRISRLVRAPDANPTAAFPQRLSDTGCVDPADPRRPAPGLIPYEVAAPFWSDGLDKRRWVALPDGAAATAGPSGDLSFPVGTVAMKEFSRDGVPIETRFYFHHQEGVWGGYTYKWDADGRDATLVPAGSEVHFDDLTWTIPSGDVCGQCHGEGSGRTLGLETRQLARSATYGDVVADQLATWSAIGLLADPGEVSPFAASGDATRPVDERARAWLHTNCAGCHLAGGAGQGGLDLRYDTPLADMHLCEVAPENGDMGIAGSVLLRPGKPEESVLLSRITSLDGARMPPVGSTVVDQEGVEVVRRWIQELTACP